MKALNRMTALLSTATVFLCLAGGCSNNNSRNDSMADDTAAFSREPDVAEPIDTNMPDGIKDRSPDIPGDDSRQRTGLDSLKPSPQVP